MEEPKRVVGTTKFFNNVKGWGFIECAASDDIFVHFRNIESNDEYKTLNEGQAVEFEIMQTDRGLQAIHVKPLAASI